VHGLKHVSPGRPGRDKASPSCRQGLLRKPQVSRVFARIGGRLSLWSTFTVPPGLETFGQALLRVVAQIAYEPDTRRRWRAPAAHVDEVVRRVSAVEVEVSLNRWRVEDEPVGRVGHAGK
jgi:hypothetical protein